jgi:ribosomal protein L3 glutamine methyltransferase
MDLEEPVQQLSTVRDFIRWGASRFAEEHLVFGHGTDNAIDESAVLVHHVIRLPFDIPPDFMNAVLTSSERQRIVDLIDRRIYERKPAAYLIREAWFAGLSFYVDERVVVPRSPLGEFIENGFQPWLGEKHVESVLDIGTGSGCIAVACAYAFPEAEVDATDVSQGALDVARINVDAHGMTERIELIDSDLFEMLGERRYSIVVANPPYVADTQMRRLPPEFRAEPSLGLASGEAGLDHVLRILRDANDHLEDDSLLVVEVGASQAALTDLLPEVPFTWLEFERGGEGVFLLTGEQVQEYHAQFNRVAAAQLERRTRNRPTGRSMGSGGGR